MATAYTGYKFKKMFGLVFGIMILLAMLSLLNPAKEEVKNVLIDEVAKIDTTGIANETYETYKNIAEVNPKAKAEKESGNYFMKLLQGDFVGFLFLALAITCGLFILGVRLRPVRKYSRGLQRSTRGW